MKSNRLQKAFGICLTATLLSACLPQESADSDATATISKPDKAEPKVPREPETPQEPQTPEEPEAPQEPDLGNLGSTNINGVVGLNYYATERDAKIYFQIGTGNTVSDWTVRASVAGETYEKLINRAGEHFLTVPLAALSQGSHDVELAVLDSGKGERWSGQDKLVLHYSPADATRITQIDRHKRIMLVDGEPFFPIGVFGVNNELNKEGKNNLELVSEAGFNVTMRWKLNTTRPAYNRDASVQDNEAVVHDYLDAVHAAGLYAFETPVKLAEEGLYEHYDDSNAKWNETWPVINGEVVPGVVELAKNHPAVIGYYSYDEPDNRYACCPDHYQYKLMEDGVEDYYRIVKAADPYHAVLTLFAVGLSKNQDWEAWDVAAQDYYPGETSHLSRVYRSVAANKKVTDELNQPFIATPLFEKSSGRGKPLNGAEQRAQTYLSLIGGAKGLLYWEWPAAYEDNWLAIKKLVSEINDLEPVLLERVPEQRYEYIRPETENSVRALVKNQGGNTYLIIANAENAAVDVTYELPSRYSDQAEILFDGGFASFDNGRFSETLPAYARRVYKFHGFNWKDGESIRFDIGVGENEGIVNPLFNENPSKNFVRNGSFSYSYGSAPGWPMAWYANDTIYDAGETGSNDGRWAIDETEYYDGRQSMRLHKHFAGAAGGDDLYQNGHAPNLVQNIALPSAGDYRVSFYVKAEKPGQAFWIFLNNGLPLKPDFCASAPCDWERFETNVSTGSANLNLRLILRGEGKVWIDAVQVEEGSVTSSFVEEGLHPDTRSPDAPGAPESGRVTDTEITISWNPPHDNAGAIKEYQIYNDGTFVATTNLVMHSLTGLTPQTNYSNIRVKAVDWSGNVSDFSPPAKNAVTLASGSHAGPAYN